jgi:hypothetical protein
MSGVAGRLGVEEADRGAVAPACGRCISEAGGSDIEG